MRKNGCVAVGNTEMNYVSFGNGNKKLVVPHVVKDRLVGEIAERDPPEFDVAAEVGGEIACR